MNKRPWTIELEPYHGSRRLITIVSPRGVVARCGDTSTPGAMEDAQLIVRAVNAHAALVAACEAWDQGFVDGEDFSADQFLAWVNRNRALARAALAEARHE